MAIFHMSVQVIGRSGGRSITAAAAYRSGDRVESDETGITHDYTRKTGVVYSRIDLPDHAPKEFADRQTLWNAVEKKESNKNAQLAREIEVSLPKELTRDEQISLMQEYVQDNFVSRGMVADWSIHDKGDGNPHCHILLTMRPFKEDGSWGAKSRTEYKLDVDGNRIPIIDPATGEQKIGAHGRRLWERETVPSTNWNDRERIFEWRENWADVCNDRLEVIGADLIDARSFEAQGIDLEPTRHEGYAAREIEARGGFSDICQENRDIIERNELRQDRIELAKDYLEAGEALKDALLNQIETVGDAIDKGLEAGTGSDRIDREAVKFAEEDKTDAVGLSEADEREGRVDSEPSGEDRSVGRDVEYDNDSDRIDATDEERFDRKGSAVTSDEDDDYWDRDRVGRD